MEQLDGPNERSVTPLGPDQEDANLDPTKRRRNRKVCRPAPRPSATH